MLRYTKHYFSLWTVAIVLTMAGKSSATSNCPQTPGIHELEMVLGYWEHDSVLSRSARIGRCTQTDPAHPGAPLRRNRSLPFYGKGLLTQLIEPALRDLGAIIIAPGQSQLVAGANMASETKVLQLLYELQKHYTFDEQRTLVTGYSMGGIGTWYFAMHQRRCFLRGDTDLWCFLQPVLTR